MKFTERLGWRVLRKSRNKFLKGKVFTIYDIGWPTTVLGFWLGDHVGTVITKHFNWKREGRGK